MRTLALILASSTTLWAGEYAVLATGFRLHVERHSTEGAATTLYLAGGGSTTVPASQIETFEAEDAPASAAARPAEPASAPAKPGLDAMIQQVAERHGVHPALVSSVVAAESASNPKAVSPKGAVGLMQLMPGTAKDLGVSNPMDAAQNLEGGTAYLRQLLERYQGYDNQLERAVAAYNAGPGKVDLHGGMPPYRETVDFVSRVSSILSRRLADTSASASPSTAP